jgi:hypothetical protein
MSNAVSGKPVTRRAKKLLRQLRKAALLSKRGVLSSAEYSALVVDTVDILTNKEVRVPDSDSGAADRQYESIRFHMYAAGALGPDREWPDYDWEGTKQTYGEYPSALHILHGAIHGPLTATVAKDFRFVWTPEADRILQDARHRLSPVHRRLGKLERTLRTVKGTQPYFLPLVKFSSPSFLPSLDFSLG